MHTRKSLAEDLRRLGVAEGDTVMVHASVRAVGEVIGGPDEIHLAIRDAIGVTGTMFMLLGCLSYYDDVGRSILSAEQEAEVLENHPVYDPLTVRAARDIGTLAEFFRSWPGTLVNNHVTRFGAAGANAEHLLREHSWNYSLGRGGPLERFLELDGKILLLQSDHDTVTFLHYVEHIADFDGKTITRFKVPWSVAGERVWLDCEEVDSNVAHPNWPDRFFALLTDSYLAQSHNPGGKVGNAMSHLFPARDLVRFAEPIMKAVAADASAAAGLRELPPLPSVPHA